MQNNIWKDFYIYKQKTWRSQNTKSQKIDSQMLQLHQTLECFLSDGPDFIILENSGKHKHMLNVKPHFTSQSQIEQFISTIVSNLQWVQPLQAHKHAN